VSQLPPDQEPFTDHLTQFIWHKQKCDLWLSDSMNNVMTIHRRKDMADYHQSHMDKCVDMFRRIMMHNPGRITTDWMRMCYP